jgi:hypothetical protein
MNIKKIALLACVSSFFFSCDDSTGPEEVADSSSSVEVSSEEGASSEEGVSSEEGASSQEAVSSEDESSSESGISEEEISSEDASSSESGTTGELNEELVGSWLSEVSDAQSQGSYVLILNDDGTLVYNTNSDAFTPGTLAPFSEFAGTWSSTADEITMDFTQCNTVDIAAIMAIAMAGEQVTADDLTLVEGDCSNLEGGTSSTGAYTVSASELSLTNEDQETIIFDRQ